MTDSDYPFLKELLRLPENLNMAGPLDLDKQNFFGAVRAGTWSTPMVLLQDGEAVAGALLGAVDTQHQHGRLVVLAREPRRSPGPLSLYLRQVFWSHPLHRVYAVLPGRHTQAGGYGALLNACGFVREGCLAGHLRVGSRLLDLELLGLLRSEFDAWCGEHQPSWVLK